MWLFCCFCMATARRCHFVSSPDVSLWLFTEGRGFKGPEHALRTSARATQHTARRRCNARSTYSRSLGTYITNHDPKIIYLCVDYNNSNVGGSQTHPALVFGWCASQMHLFLVVERRAALNLSKESSNFPII